MDHARQFASRMLPQPVPGKGWINLHWSQTGTNGNKFWDGRACASVDEFVKTLEWLGKTEEPKDIYAAMSLQGRMEEKTSKRGYTYKKALRSTTDAVALKSLYIDVDVKDGAYADTREALAALKEFITSCGMTNPTAVVASGSGGFHAHWALNQDLPHDEWQILANALAQAAQEHGLKFDSQCTVDAARILRVPDTFNYKSGEPKPVRLLSLGADVSVEEMREALLPYTIASPLLPMGTATELTDELGAGVDDAKAPPVIIDEVAKHCGFISRSIATGGRDNANPLWFLTAAIAAFAEDGRDALHTMSKGHPGYKQADTDELFDRAVAKQKEKNLGWPKCSKIAGYGAPECKGCPLLAKNKSPLNFATATASEVDKTMPDRFVRNPNGTIAVRAIQDDGTPFTITLTQYPIWSGWLSPQPWTLHFTTVLAGKSVNFDLPAEVIGSKDGLAKFMCAKGFFVGDKEAKYLKEFFMAWIQKLQTTKDAVVAAQPFGWSINNGKIDGFAYGGRVWDKTGDRPAADAGGSLSYQYTPKGDPKVWQELAGIVYKQQRPALNVILASAFAGPLVFITGHDGLLLSGYSTESGIGKTTSMKCAQAVWGHPKLAMAALDDTKNSVLGKMGKLMHLPFYWDEIKSEEQVRTFTNLVFNMSGGKEKARMNADTSQRDMGEWKTLLVSATNESLVDPMIAKNKGTPAGFMRMFEYQVKAPPMKHADTSVVQRIIGSLEYNFGHAGLTYAKFLGANYERVTDEVAQYASELNEEVNAEIGERLWTSVITVVMKGAQYANELGLLNVDLPAMKEFLLEVLAGMRKELGKSSTDGSSEIALGTILANFINANRHDMLETNRTWVSRGKPPKGMIQVLNDPTRIKTLGIHLSREDRMLRISSTYFTEWMGKNGHSRKIFLDKMEKEYGLEVKPGRLASGTDLVSALEQLVVIDLNHPQLSQIIE